MSRTLQVQSQSESLGWPWSTAETRAKNQVGNLPRITVITPSYNQAAFLEQTIRSVVFQGYSNLEYFIFDGGSIDSSVDIIRKYEKDLSYWESRSNRGQAHAINKGLRRSTGEILCWLNSDDFFLPGTLHFVAEQLGRDSRNYALVGDALKIYEDGQPSLRLEGKYEDRRRLLEFWKGYQMHQSSIFWRREVFDRVGYLDEELNF